MRQGDRIERVEIVRVGTAADAFTADQASFDSAVAGAEERVRAAREEAQRDTIARIEEQFPGTSRDDNGIWVRVDRAGTGASPRRGREVTVHYTGQFLDGRVFDSSRQRGPFQFPVGAGRVIRGWDITVSEMREGEIRTIVLPPELAYGSSGAGGVIPPDAFLVFEIELLDAGS
ncbi:MAG: FKBP-type peptidyl-prolyl cis-trans isomerase [Spirochaetales bacterium]|nr:FKBP-type peptidyl-prolyl cis-trans isomerase [Spirochaetales bacterium]